MDTRVYGWRAWTLQPSGDGKGGNLTSLMKRTVWPVEGAMAECIPPFTGGGSGIVKGPHDVAIPACKCGFHGCATHEDLVREYGKTHYVPSVRHVMGMVLGWGRGVLGEAGWRMQYARPIALYENLKSREQGYVKLMLEVAEGYAVPILMLDEIEDYARWYGRSMSEMLEA